MAENSQLQFIWKQIKERLQHTLSPISFDHFIKDIEPMDIIGRKIILKVPTDNNAQGIITHKIGEKLREVIVKCNLGINDFHIFVDLVGEAFDGSAVNSSGTKHVTTFSVTGNSDNSACIDLRT